ncbi:OmpP1/FadL family transporter [Burkholderia ambifaria]|uniref:OmpP1/FadL family transporter n=1 Tax=Burkholderia ambifaria TaxID=152480 RepID=UPI000F812EAA|nr:outer membrane protein transport protein [Burkholderia ambifaria]
MNWKKGVVATGLGLHAMSAWCINAADMTGYGAASLGMGGASIANPQDTLAGASNPAGMAFVGNSLDLDMVVFNGSSSSTYLESSNAIHQSISTVVPNFGLNYHFAPRWTFGISGSAGGAGVNYDTATFPIPGAPRAESSLGNARIVHSVTFRPVDNLALGLGLVLGYQRFESEGSIVPGPTGTPTLLPSHGLSQALGIGMSAGVVWRVVDWLTLGASYMSTTHMGRIHGYSQDLLASVNGRLDLPPSYGVGFAVHPTQRVTIAGDWEQIRWADSQGFKTLFGWKNQNVIRGGISWDATSALTLRAGISHATEVVSTEAVAQNIYSPGINTLAYTAGASYDWKNVGRFSIAYEYDPTKTLVGTGRSTGSSISGHVQMLLLGYQRRF